MRGDGGVTLKGELLMYQSFIPGVKCSMALTNLRRSFKLHLGV